MITNIHEAGNGTLDTLTTPDSPTTANTQFFILNASNPSDPSSGPETGPTPIPAWVASEIRSSNIIPTLPDPSAAPVVPLSWNAISEAITNHRVGIFKRNPADRVVYKAWCRDTIAQYGSMTAYMCARRLQWMPLASSTSETGPLFKAKNTIPFADPADWKILFNDWPYGSLEPEIVHLIVWLKVRIETDPESGLPTPESKKRCQDFVNTMFVRRLNFEPVEGENGKKNPVLTAEDKVLWFKNPPALQTVAGLEHIHVLVRCVPQAILEEWTGETGPQHEI